MNVFLQLTYHKCTITCINRFTTDFSQHVGNIFTIILFFKFHWTRNTVIGINTLAKMYEKSFIIQYVFPSKSSKPYRAEVANKSNIIFLEQFTVFH